MASRTKSQGISWHLIAIIAIAFGFFLVGIDRLSVPTVDGAVRASMARNMVRNGTLWPIFYEGRIFADHPPLFIWLTALSYKIFGMGDFAANLMPRLFAFLTVVVTAYIALAAGYSRAVALASALILCLTRDFVLSSVRGYIEPLLEFFTYAGVFFTLRSHRPKSLLSAALAAVCIWLAAFSKGPVALWPFLFCLMFVHKMRGRFIYLASFTFCTLLWALWSELNGHWPYWSRYLHEQVLGSALEGRGGAQRLEPFYFASILAQYYWPWLPLFAYGIYKCIRDVIAKKVLHDKSIQLRLLALLLAMGFIGGFSLMKWKYWYYIAPAYPAMALFIAFSFEKQINALFGSRGIAQKISYAAIAWCIVASIFPIRLHRERVPEVLAFKDTIRNSNVTGSVWFLHNPMDHNMIGTSGEWYFDRIVEKVENEKDWEANKLRAPAWIITGAEYQKSCDSDWCKRSTLIQSAGKSALLYYAP